MFLVVAATDFEIAPVRVALGAETETGYLVSGVGPMETAMRLTRHLAARKDSPEAVINFGVAGGYLADKAALLDICLAEQEIFGDLGICSDGRILDLHNEKMSVRTRFIMDRTLLRRAVAVLTASDVPMVTGNFVTVSCVSGTALRGNYLRDAHRAVCENMEGASVAMVCAEFGLPCVELRCISNLVDDRNTEHWQMQEACRRGGEAVALLIKGLSS